MERSATVVLEGQSDSLATASRSDNQRRLLSHFERHSEFESICSSTMLSGEGREMRVNFGAKRQYSEQLFNESDLLRRRDDG